MKNKISKIEDKVYDYFYNNDNGNNNLEDRKPLNKYIIILSITLAISSILALIYFANQDLGLVLTEENYNKHNFVNILEPIETIDTIEPIYQGFSGHASVKEINTDKLVDFLRTKGYLYGNTDKDFRELSQEEAKEMVDNYFIIKVPENRNLKNGDFIDIDVKVLYKKLLNTGYLFNEDYTVRVEVQGLENKPENVKEFVDSKGIRTFDLFEGNRFRFDYRQANSNEITIMDRNSSYEKADVLQNGFFIWYYTDSIVDEEGYINVHAKLLVPLDYKLDEQIQTVEGTDSQYKKIKLGKVNYTY